MKTYRISWLAWLALACCGSTHSSGPTGQPDAASHHDAASHDDAAAPEAGAIVGACGAGVACPSGSTCFFPIGSCAAKGACIENPSPGTPECKALESLCGCDGTPVTAGCGFPEGYASGPTTGGAGMSCSGADAGHANDGGATACPAAQPTPGATCYVAFDCEYGSDPDVDCDTVVSCIGGHWTVTTTPATTGCGTTNPPACPATYATLGTSCVSGESCSYPEARCDCSSQCGMAGHIGPDGGPEAEWCCPDAPESGGQCPSPRPRLGTECSTTAQECDYGGCSGNVTLQCTDGVWVRDTEFGCPA